MNLDQKSIFFGKRYIVFSIIIAIFAAFALNTFIQYRIEAISFVWDSPLLYIYTSLILLCAICICSALSGNVFIGSTIMFGLFILITFADRNKFAVRSEHVFPEDLIVSNNIGAFSGMYDPAAYAKQILLIVIFVAVSTMLTILIVRARKKAGMYEKPLWSSKELRKRMLIRIIIAAICFLFLVALSFPLMNRGNVVTHRLGFYNISWSQNINYANNGFVAAFTSNIGRASLEMPYNYSKEMIEGIVNKYSDIAETNNVARIDIEDDDIDIIFILNESFFDPERISDSFPISGGDVTPNLHELETQIPAGILRTTQFGGGTANVEFEVLTGFSLFFFEEPISAFQDLFAVQKSFPSFASFLQETGNYQAFGMHPYDPGMYKRSTVYPILGFNDFLSQNDFSNGTPYSTANYISDASAYDEVFSRIDAVESGENVFVNLVTMQNHGATSRQLEYHPYNAEVDPPEAYSSYAFDDYLALLTASDAMLGDLATRVLEREKKTMILFYGDHLPGVFNDILGENDDRRYETPLLILANFGDPYFEIGTVSPNYLPAIALNYMNAQKSPFFYLLDDVKSETPILTRNYFNMGEEPELVDAFADYYMIMYDTISGHRYSEKMGFFSLK